jgi:tellurite resistance protein TerC
VLRVNPLRSAGSKAGFVDLHVPGWAWPALLGFILALLLVDLLVLHRRPHEVHTREAALESAAWISIGLGFSFVIWWAYGAPATGEYLSGYLIEKSLSVDNVFVWALLFAHFKVANRHQHRVLFWGIFGALVLRAAFIFAGIGLIGRFEWILVGFGAFLIYTAFRIVSGRDAEADPSNSKAVRFVGRVVPVSDHLDGAKLFTRVDGLRRATPLFAVLVIVELTDVLFAVDSVPAVLAVSHTSFLVFSSNAFAILGLRALYFLLADMHARFTYLEQGLAVILAFVGLKMVVSHWYHLATWFSLSFIALVLAASVVASMRLSPAADELPAVREDEA